MRKVLYMKVTADALELPLTVADSVKELSELTGTTANTISSIISKGEKGLYIHPSYKRVYIDDTEDE